MSGNLVLKKIIVFAAPILVVVLWEIWLSLATAVVEIGILTLAVVVFSMWYLTLRSVAISQLQTKLHRQEFWRFLITPVFLVTSLYLFILILESGFWKQVVVFGGNIILLLILQNLYHRFYRNATYPAHSFESLSGNVNSISLFFLSVTAYGFITFLDFSGWQPAIFLLLSTTILTYQLMWISGINLRKSWLYILVTDLCVVEIFWALLFLPNTFYVKALVMTVVYYLIVSISRNYLIELLTNKMIRRYLLVGISVLLLVLLTAQWV